MECLNIIAPLACIAFSIAYLVRLAIACGSFYLIAARPQGWISQAPSRTRQWDSDAQTNGRHNQPAFKAKKVEAAAKHEPADNHQTATDNAPNPMKRTWYDWLSLGLQISIFVVGCYVACVYSGQLREMITQNILMRQSLEDSEYSTVLISDILRQSDWMADVPLKFQAHFLSAGRAPAFEVYASLYYRLASPPPEISVAPPTPEPTPRRAPTAADTVCVSITIAPGVREQQPFTAPALQVGESRSYDFTTHSLSADDIQDITSGKRALYVEGELRFRGLSPTKVVQTHACMVYHAQHIPGRPTPDRFIPCPTGYSPPEPFSCPTPERVPR